jgi:hypothetical protein
MVRTPFLLLFGITYVDNETKSVFKGNSLDKYYRAKGIQERCESPISNREKNDYIF